MNQNIHIILLLWLSILFLTILWKLSGSKCLFSRFLVQLLIEKLCPWRAFVILSRALCPKSVRNGAFWCHFFCSFMSFRAVRMVKWNNHRYCHVFLTDFHRNVPIGLLRHSDFRIEWRRIFLENQKKKNAFAVASLFVMESLEGLSTMAYRCITSTNRHGWPFHVWPYGPHNQFRLAVVAQWNFGHFCVYVVAVVSHSIISTLLFSPCCV